MTPDFEAARTRMVDCQVRTVDVTNPAVLDAFLAVAREDFVPADRQALAYLDEELAYGSQAPKRYLIAPAQLAKMVQAVALRETHRVLDVGCGSGYSTAILARLCSYVTGLESDAGLAELAVANMKRSGVVNSTIVTGPLDKGHATGAPYDVILVGGAVEVMPEALLAQLADGGRLIAVAGHGNAGVAQIWTQHGDVHDVRRLFNCALPLLPGFAKTPEFVF